MLTLPRVIDQNWQILLLKGYKMSTSVKFDINRMKKTYPLIRKKPKFVDFTDAGEIAGVEVATLTFANSSSEIYPFTKNYVALPICVISAESDDVNVYISALALDTITVESSFPFTGKVHLHIYEDTES
jgi:hypothetical protein